MGQLHLYAASDRASRQIGYGVDGRTSLPLSGWDTDKAVIGDIEGDPISRDQCTGKIYYALHGMGVWKFKEIAPSEAMLAKFLTFWRAYYHDIHDQDLFDDNDLISQASLDEISAALKNLGFKRMHIRAILHMIYNG